MRFTTRGLAPDARVQLWEGHNARALLPLDIRTIDESPMLSEQMNLHLPSVRIADVRGTSQIVERSESFINQHPTGMIAVFFAIEGEAMFLHRGGHMNLLPGQAVVYDADRPFTRAFSRGLREIVLTIPKKIYSDLIGSAGPDLPAIFHFGAGAGTHERALADLLRTTLQMAAATGSAAAPSDLVRSEEEALGLMRLILGSRDSSTVGLLTSARGFIERHLRDRSLGPARVAAAVGVSERQLARYFSDAGTTVSRYITERRLELARDILASPDHWGLSVSEVTAAAGFTNPSHFGRVFRERFGITPLQWRKETRRGHLYD